MVTGLKIFQDFFAKHTDDYILIGGTACELNLASHNLEFRATRDLDIVLSIEAHNAEFFQTFWQFIREGQYAIGEKSSGKKQFYRFKNPSNPNFPIMLELFSKRTELFEIAENSTLTPIPADDESSSLSAILLDEDYYKFIQDNRILINGLSVISAIGLLILKAKAWIDLSERKGKGEQIDAKNINKHKNDIARLIPVISSEPLILAQSIKDDMIIFLEKYSTQSIDTKALKIPMTSNSIHAALKEIFAQE